jgi:hypothetical protein
MCPQLTPKPGLKTMIEKIMIKFYMKIKQLGMNLKKKSIKKTNETERNYNEKNEDQIKKIRYEIEKKINLKKR